MSQGFDRYAFLKQPIFPAEPVKLTFEQWWSSHPMHATLGRFTDLHSLLKEAWETGQQNK